MEEKGRGKMETIGVLTSGGDAPGMNAAVRSVVRTALYHKMNVKGIFKGYNGLLNNLMQDMSLRSVSETLGRGGTKLYTARSPEFRTPEGVEKAARNCISAGIDGLVVIGGDGSFRGARELSLRGVPCIGIPGTIDNDIACTEYTIGFDTAVNTVVENIDRLRDTSQSHERCSVVEVMGRRCGDIAVHSAICSGAVSVLVPEIHYDLDTDVIDKMMRTLKTGKNHFIVIVAEGVTEYAEGKNNMNAFEIAQYIENKTGVETRATVLGHIQRGGVPTARDRVVASEMGHYAVGLLKNGVGNRVICLRENEIVDLDILEALEIERPVDYELYRVANEISI